MNLPARAFQFAGFVYGNGGTDTDRYDALSVFRCVNSECHGILTEQPYNVFAVVKRDVMAQESLAAANVCASQYFDMQNNYSLSAARLLRMMLALGNQIMIGGHHEARR